MAIILKPCVDEDMDQVFDLLSSAFGPNDPYMATVYPNHEDLAKRAHRGKRMLATERGRAKSTYIKAIDEETGDIVGMAKWLVAVNVLMEAERLEGDFWADEDSKELARFVSTSVRHLRYKRLMERQGYLAALEILCVDPRYQRQGIGDSLVRWGLEIADANGLEAVIESTVAGKNLYKRHGFQEREEIVIPFPPKWETHQEMSFTWMIRPVQHSSPSQVEI